VAEFKLQFPQMNILYLAYLSSNSHVLYETIRDYLKKVEKWDVCCFEDGKKENIDAIVVQGEAWSLIPANLKGFPIVAINTEGQLPIWRVCALQVNIGKDIPRFEGAMPGQHIEANSILSDEFKDVLERIIGHIKYWQFVYSKELAQELQIFFK
jgi:hypothetical protein